MKRLALVLMLMSVTAQAQEGMASVYGNENGQWRRADGHKYNPWQIGCAHKSIRLGSIIVVTNLETLRRISCTVNDRGPYTRGRILDLSFGAAKALGVHKLARVRIQ